MRFALIALLLQQVVGNGGLDYQAVRRDRRIQAIRVDEKITIDGVLNEKAWEQASTAGAFTQSEPREGVPATEDTNVKVLYDSENLYFGVFAHDSEAGKLIISDLKKDFETRQGDYIEIVLDTFRDERNGYLFSTNPAGAKRDAQLGNEGRENNSSWDGVWFVKTRIVDSGWFAEIAIPFKTLKFPTTDQQTWGVNFSRNIRRKNEETFWAPIPRIYDLTRVSMAGTLEGLEGIRPGLNLKMKPYVVANFAQDSARRWKNDGDFGFDAKYGLTSGLTWDFTYNTDFSQVEADTQQINLTRFNLFFPEKRDFFLENSGVFVFGSNEGRGPIGFNAQSGTGGGGSFGGSGTTGPGRQNQVASDLILFFSRRIGLSDDGQAIPIAGGTRLTGRAGRFEIGLLNIQQRKNGTTAATNFSVARVKRNILANSDVGVMLVNKDESGSHYNRAYGFDANFRLWKDYYLNGYVAKTDSPLTKGKGEDLAKRISAGYKIDLLDLRLSYVEIGRNFRDEVGFMPRTGIKNFNSWTGIHIRPKSLRRWIREFHPHVATEYVVGPDDRFDTRYTDYHFRVTFQDGASIEVGDNPSYERLTAPLRLPRNEFIPVGAYQFPEKFISANTNTSKRVSFSGRFGTGGFYTGYKRGYQAGTIVRFNHKFNSALSYTRNNIDLPHRKPRTDLVSLRTNYSFSSAMFLNALIQYNSDTRQVSSNIRFNIIHRPLSDFFLVYNERRDSIGNLVDRALIAKFTYMVSR